MRLSTRSRYGARATLEMARNWGKCHTKRKDIARSQSISESYLENILIALKNDGIVRTVRGARGGFSLTRAPSDITLFEVISSLEGDLSPVECAVKADACDRSARCAMRRVYERLKRAQEEVLGSYTLQDLVEQTKALGIQDFCI